jgi:hypothetical protein
MIINSRVRHVVITNRRILKTATFGLSLTFIPNLVKTGQLFHKFNGEGHRQEHCYSMTIISFFKKGKNALKCHGSKEDQMQWNMDVLFPSNTRVKSYTGEKMHSVK